MILFILQGKSICFVIRGNSVSFGKCSSATYMYHDSDVSSCKTENKS